MKINLFTTFYLDKNLKRHDELKYALFCNMGCNYNSYSFLLENETDYNELMKILGNFPSVNFVLGKRPTFNDFFEHMDSPEFNDSINILCNSDIGVLSIQEIKDFYSNTDNRKTCLALSRWDKDDTGKLIHFDRSDSQDTWIFYGNPKMRTSIEFGMGVAGCDNRLAWEIQQNGYKVINPSKLIGTIHHHKSNIRNYLNTNGEPIERVPPPYLLVPTT